MSSSFQNSETLSGNRRGIAHRKRLFGRLLHLLLGVLSTLGVTDVVAAMKEWLPVVIDGKPFELEVVVDVPDRDPPENGWPVVLITHGAPGGSTPPEDIGPDLLGRWVRFFSGRGYYAVAVARRGYASSDGSSEPASDGDSCADPAVDTYIDGNADDLVAVARALRDRPEADTDRVVAMGHSAGGAAVLALNGRLDGLVGIVNVVGGVYRYEPGAPGEWYSVFANCERYRHALVDAIGQLGARGETPSLWIYPANDPFFDTTLVGDLSTAWSATRAPEPVLEILPAVDNAHSLFLRSEGPDAMGPSIDAFLADRSLPALTSAFETRMRECVPIGLLPDALSYLTGQMHRAVAIADDASGLFSVDGASSPRAARDEALAMCGERSGAGCSLLAHDDEFDVMACPDTGSSD